MPARALRLIVLFALCLPAACESGAVNREARTEREAVRASANALHREPTCDDGDELGPDCGLVTEHLASLRYRREFQKKYCVAATADQCQRRYLDKVAAALARRYPYADPAAVARNCRKPDADCHDLVAYELVVLETHDAAVSRIAARRDDGIERRRRAHQAAFSRYLSQALEPLCISNTENGGAAFAFCPL